MSVPERDRLAHRIADALNDLEPAWRVIPARVWTTKDCRPIADAVLAAGYRREESVADHDDKQVAQRWAAPAVVDGVQQWAAPAVVDGVQQRAVDPAIDGAVRDGDRGLRGRPALNDGPS